MPIQKAFWTDRAIVHSTFIRIASKTLFALFSLIFDVFLIFLGIPCCARSGTS